MTNSSSISQLALPVEGLQIESEIALTIPAPRSGPELEALRWFVGQQPDETMASIVQAHEDWQYWQQRGAQAALDGGW